MSQEDFFAAVCGGMGWKATPKRLEAFRTWARYEDKFGRLFTTAWNPLATTWYVDGQSPFHNKNYSIGYGPGNWNWVPVKVYATEADGIEATVKTLRQPQYYKMIREMFEKEQYVEGVAQDFAVWSGSGYSDNLAADMKAIFGAPVLVQPEPLDLNTALLMRFDIASLAFGDFDTMVAVHKYLVTGGSVPKRAA